MYPQVQVPMEYIDRSYWWDVVEQLRDRGEFIEREEDGEGRFTESWYMDHRIYTLQIRGDQDEEDWDYGQMEGVSVD